MRMKGTDMRIPKIPLGPGRRVFLDGGQVLTVTDKIQAACDEAIWNLILDRKHPGEGYKAKGLEQLEVLRKELRVQLPFREDDPSTRLGRDRIVFLASWLGQWDLESGKDKIGWAEPVRSLMDIPMIPECKAHGLMHDCKEV